MKHFDLVVVESPYSPTFAKTCEAPPTSEFCSCAWHGELGKNLDYARKCMADCLLQDEAPFSSHLLYTQNGVLDDTNPEERKVGIEAGFAWREKASRTIVYVDRGISPGMKLGIDDAKKKCHDIEYRRLNWRE